MPEFSRSNITVHRFHVDNNMGKSVIGYGIIIGRDLMLQLGLLSDFKHKVIQWDDAIIKMKELSGLLGQIGPTSREMLEVVMHTSEPVSTREST